MTWRGPTFRISDGETIDGAWRLVWSKHDRLDEHHTEHLFVYADGRITHGYEATDLAGLGRLLASGKIALDPPGAREWTAEPSTWGSRSPEPRTDEGFLLEVADEIARLAGRPTAADRCWDAVRSYQAEPTPERRARLRDAYLAVPAHLRVYVLGDMDLQDRPLRILTTDPGEAVGGDGPVVTEELHRRALAYFTDQDARVEQAGKQQALRYADDPAGDPQPPVVLHQRVYPQGRPAELGDFALRNDYDAPFTYEGRPTPPCSTATGPAPPPTGTTTTGSAPPRPPTRLRSWADGPSGARTGPPCGSRSWPGCCAPSSGSTRGSRNS